MKQGKFITDSSLFGKRMAETWEDIWKNGFENRRFNSKSIPLEGGDGLLMVRGRFHLKEGEKAVIRATALGVFDLYVNGVKVGRDELKPEWTDYRFRLFEYEYDITELCREENVVTATVSPGWYGCRMSQSSYGEGPVAFVCEVETDSGIFASDESWETCVGGRITFADIYDGEYCDMTRPDVHTESDKYEWRHATLTDVFKGEIVPHVGPYVRVDEGLSIVPEKYTLYRGATKDESDFGTINRIEYNGRLAKGDTLLIDGGQNTVGRPVIKYSAKRGTVITVYFAEMLNHSGNRAEGNDGPKGSAYIENYRSALSRMTFVASGDGVEEYFVTHTFFGFRYIEIEADGEVEIHSVKFEFLGSELNITGSFECDSPEINRLYSNCYWGMRDNYLSVPTDCPQRDERLGWTGDTLAFAGAGAYIADIEPFMTKWFGDLRDSQKDFFGCYADVVPRINIDNTDPSGWAFGGSTAWSDAGVLVPYILWKMYGADRLIKEHYSSMEDYIAYLLTLEPQGPVGKHGDWLAVQDTDKQYIADCYFLRCLKAMSEMGEAFGRDKYYLGLYNEFRDRWYEKYIKDEKLIFTTQCAYVLCLRFDIVDGKVRDNCIEGLKKAVLDSGKTLTTGFLGTGHICPTLTECGMSDLAYDLLFSHEYPGWLFSVDQGATTMWERWSSFTLDKGFGDVNMNSFNHYAYGSVAEWLYSGVAGIKPAERGFKTVRLEPVTDRRGRINRVRAEYRGIVSEWTRAGDEVTYRFRTPVRADITLRDDSAEGGVRTFTVEAGEHEIKTLEKLMEM